MPAGYPARIRPMSRLLKQLEEFAMQGGRPALADVPPDDRSPAAIRRRIAADLRARGWSRLTLAKRMGFESERTVSVLMTRVDQSPSRRRLLENCMGVAYWSTPEEMAARQPVIRFYGGMDPHTLSVAELKKLRMKHLPFGQRRSSDLRAELIAQLEAHAAKGARELRRRGAERSRVAALPVEHEEATNP